MKIAVAGANGRMGKMLIEAVLRAKDATLVGALDVVGSPAVGTDAAQFLGRQTGVLIEADMAKATSTAECLIDFTQPEGTLAHVAYCRENNIKLVIGTTGFGPAGIRAIEEAAKQTAIVFAPNMSVGVNVTMKLLSIAAPYFSQGYDIEIIEAHHRHKMDAPSGTAIRMGEVLAKALGRSLRECASFAREGITGERNPATIGFSSIRGGDIIGDHTVLFAGIGERIEISHKSASRAAYAEGSLRAVRFLRDKVSGLFDMQDVLGLREE
jgi:4-hydroxy-tetrahydrodipicolinate reductase